MFDDRPHVLWTYAHPRSNSLNAALRDAGTDQLRRQGWTVDVNDLYADRFDPVLVDEGGEDVREQQRRLIAADLVVLQFPLWWYSVPAILKGWIDRVFERGFAYDVRDPATGRSRKYGDGGLVGRRALVVTTAGDRANSISPRGISGDVEDIFWPLLHGTLWYTGMDVLEPHVITDAHTADLGDLVPALRTRLDTVADDAPIDYLPMTDQLYDHSIALRDGYARGRTGRFAHRR